MAKVFLRRTATRLELASFNPAHGERVPNGEDVPWRARIVWARQ